MAFANRLFAYFPLLMTLLTFAALGAFAREPSFWTLLLLCGVIYLIPPIVQRILLRWTPFRFGVSRIDERTYSSWLATHHLQAFYDALPQLESLLRVLPGFYSLWLRLWGSRVGYGVEWPVNLQVLDRGLMDIGNRVVFARGVELSAHMRGQSDGAASRVLVRPVRIGSNAFIGANARLEPGAVVPSGGALPEHGVVGVNTTLGGKPHHPAPEEAEFVAI